MTECRVQDFFLHRLVVRFDPQRMIFGEHKQKQGAAVPHQKGATCFPGTP
jgi:hypothetical protein